jgi:ligand-binding sensor domain-containing protein
MKLSKSGLIFSALVIFSFINGPFSSAQDKTNVLSFDYFSQLDGLPNNQIQCIFQDKKGWIWLGTSQGLSRFDGYRFTNFFHNPEDSASLSGNLVRVIFEDIKGTLLIGTENGGLNVFDRNKDQFLHPYKNHPEFKSKEVSVNSIVEDSMGNIYLGTDQKLLKIDESGQLVKVSPSDSPGENSFEGSFIRVMQIDNSGNLWLGTNYGLFLLHVDSNRIESIDLPLLNDQSREIDEIFKDDDGLLWIGTY